jgi:beta-galactosidase
MLFGASYYHEYQPLERLETDLDLMAAAGFSVIRVGESTWASYEPRDGEIGFDALARVVDGAHARGLKTIVGTPTYAVPPWLPRLHPEVMAHTATGSALPYGARQNVDFTHPAFRFYAERIVRRLGRHFGHHPAVIGFQVDNETGIHHLANPHVVQRFRDHVLETVGDVEAINAAWGLTYWSHRLSRIDDLWPPDGNTNPGYALEWERFQARLVTEFLTWQRDVLRDHVAADKFVTHDLIGGRGSRSADPRAVGAAMDRISANIYFPMQAALALPQPPEESIRRLAPEWMDEVGTWSVLWKADLAYSAKGPTGRRFLVSEAQAGSIGGHAMNVPPYEHQLRLVAHLLMARGADLLAYWHWHTLHYGLESYWGGVLGHDLEPNRLSAEVADLGAEIAGPGAALGGAVPDADIGILFSRDSAKALEFMPVLTRPGTSEPDPAGYHRVFARFYQGAFDHALQVRVVHPDSDWGAHRVLVVPALYIADAAVLDRLAAHARAGAHVVFTFRSGAADRWGRIRWERQPGPLRACVGADYQEYTTLAEVVPLVAGEPDGVPPLHLPPKATATGWADGLRAGTADVLCGYDDPHLGRFAAVTTQAVGEGRVTWIGTLPDRPTAGALVDWAVRERGHRRIADAWPGRPDTVNVATATTADGRRLWFVTNHSWSPATMPVPAGLSPVIPPKAAPRGSDPATIHLGPWDSCVLTGAAV